MSFAIFSWGSNETALQIICLKVLLNMIISLIFFAIRPMNC